MLYPVNIETPSTSRLVIDHFGGYNANMVIGDGEFSHVNNMTSDHYPTLCSRAPHGTYIEEHRFPILGAVYTDKLTWVYLNGSNLHIVINEETVVDIGLTSITDTVERSIIPMGAYLIILPDKMYINTADITDKGKIEVSNTASGEISIYASDENGVGYSVEYQRDEDPTLDTALTIYDGDLWLDTSSSPAVLKRYSTNQKMWLTVENVYTAIKKTDIGKSLEKGDVVDVKGFDGNYEALNGEQTIVYTEDDIVVFKKGIDGLISALYEAIDDITVERRMPLMDYVFEHENRLWGCRYGENNKGEFVNEIYACALGNFKRWFVYEGISTDSFTASVGTVGEFTGGCSYAGRPYFFKENHIHTIYGSYPATYQLDTLEGRGVLKGAHKSLAIVNEVLYYRTRGGFCAFDGTLPIGISDALGSLPIPTNPFEGTEIGKEFESAVGCGFRDKYIVATSFIANNAQTDVLFTYDTKTRIWHTEYPFSRDNLQFVVGLDDVYYFYVGNTEVLTLYGTGTPMLSVISWLAESGDIFCNTPDNKYVTRITIRLYSENDVKVTLIYGKPFSGFDEEVKHTSTIKCKGSLHSFSLPIRGLRADNFRIRIEGTGKACIYSIAKTVEFGSELRHYEV